MIEMIWLTSPERITERAQYCQALFFLFPEETEVDERHLPSKYTVGSTGGRVKPGQSSKLQSSHPNFRIIIHVHQEMLLVHFGHENTQNFVVHEVITKLGEEALSCSAVQL